MKPRDVVAWQLEQQLGNKPTSTDPKAISHKALLGMNLWEHLIFTRWFKDPLEYKKKIPATVSDGLWWELKELYKLSHTGGSPTGPSAETALFHLRDAYAKWIGVDTPVIYGEPSEDLKAKASCKHVKSVLVPLVQVTVRATADTQSKKEGARIAYNTAKKEFMDGLSDLGLTRKEKESRWNASQERADVIASMDPAEAKRRRYI
eukprot:g19898.t1